MARWRTLPSDVGAVYEKSITIDAAALEPMITYGTNPGMGMGITARVPRPEDADDDSGRRTLEKALAYMDLQPGEPLLGHKVDIVFIGSCTNSRISDLRSAAALLEGRHVAEGVRVMVVPGSQTVKAQAEREGLADVFRAAGADWREAGCSMCIAMNGDQGAPGEYIIRTSNRNFEGRQGKGARTFLASPLTAAATALTGVVTDPRPLVERVPPPQERSRPWPSPSTTFTSALIPLPAENVDTDQIIPARFLKTTEKSGLADALFNDWRYDADGTPKTRLRHQPAGDAGPPDPARRRQLRRRLVARARALGADLVGHPRHPLDELRRHLPQQRAEERPAADRRRCGHASPALRAGRGRPRRSSSPWTSRRRSSTCPATRTCAFDVDPFARRMLLDGTDEIGWLLARTAPSTPGRRRTPRESTRDRPRPDGQRPCRDQALLPRLSGARRSPRGRSPRLAGGDIGDGLG